MKLVACLFAYLCLLYLAETPVKADDVPVQDKITALQKQRAEALNRERARSKADLCAHAGDGSDPAVGNCWLREGRTTDADYNAYVRAIGALLRLSLQANRATPLPTAGSPQHLEFDTAEATWLTYRKQTCDAMTVQWEGGTMGRTAYPKCLVTVTWNHLNELDDLYSDLQGGH
jgi:uncharacterized protein YecT (DUF1311 family)